MTFLFNLIISKAAPVSYLKDLSEKRMRKSAKKKALQNAELSSVNTR